MNPITLIVENDEGQAALFAERMHGIESRTACIFTTTAANGRELLLQYSSITTVCLHGQIITSREDALAQMQ